MNVIALSSTDIQISWSEIEPIDQNGIIVRYEVIYSGGSDSNGSVITNGSSLMTNITGLEEDTEYNIFLRAHTSVGPGPFSGITTERTEEDGWLLLRVLIGMHFCFLFM